MKNQLVSELKFDPFKPFYAVEVGSENTSLPLEASLQSYKFDGRVYPLTVQVGGVRLMFTEDGYEYHPLHRRIEKPGLRLINSDVAQVTATTIAPALDLTKPVQYQGEPARVVSTKGGCISFPDNCCRYPLSNGREEVVTFTEDGYQTKARIEGYRLINVPEKPVEHKIKGFVNVYRRYNGEGYRFGAVHSDLESAKRLRIKKNTTVATIPVDLTVEEGKGL
jgi:hypothetical protein